MKKQILLNLQETDGNMLDAIWKVYQATNMSDLTMTAYLRYLIRKEYKEKISPTSTAE